MRSWQDRCFDIIDYLEDYFPEVKYKLSFSRNPKNKEKTLTVETVRNDKGSHQGMSIWWLSVSEGDIESLPEKLLLKAQERLLQWQEEGMVVVQNEMKKLQDARNELDRRIQAGKNIEKINEGQS